MANRTVEAQLRISATERTAKAFNAVSSRMDAVTRKAGVANRTIAAVGRTTGALMASSATYLAPAVLAAGTVASVKRFASVDRSVNRIGLTAGATAAETKAAFGVIDRAADDYAMSQDDIVRGLDSMVAAGRSMPEAFSFLPSVAATAQASGADIADIATTADAIGSNFEIAGNKMQDAFDILTTAGKLGKFELKDMASYLPSMAPAFAALGYKGESAVKKLASWLQVVRARTGSAGEAATAFSNVLQKIETEETAKKFSEFGVDLRKELAKARREGKDILEVFMSLVQVATKGDLSKLPQLFGDAQVITGIRAMMLGTGDMANHMAAMANATGAVRKDLDVILADPQARLDRLTSTWDKMVKSLGRGAVAAGAIDSMEGVSDTLDYHSAVNEGLEKNGVHGFWERTKFGLTSTQEEKNRMAYEGGWRSSDLSDKGKMADSPELPSRRQDDVRATPSTGAIPVPQVRPVLGAAELPELKPDRFPIGDAIFAREDKREFNDWQTNRERKLAENMETSGASSFFRIPSKEEFRAAMAVEMNRSVRVPSTQEAQNVLPVETDRSGRIPSTQEFQDATAVNTNAGGSDKIEVDATPLKDGADQAKQSIADGGREAGKAIEESSAFFKIAGVDVGAAISAAILSAFNSGADQAVTKLNNVRIPAPNMSNFGGGGGGGNGRPKVNGDVGRSMPPESMQPATGPR